MPQFFKLLIDFAVNTTQVSLEDQTRIFLDGIAYVGITALQAATGVSRNTILKLVFWFWKYVKGELRCSFYDDFGAFCSRIDKIVASEKGWESYYKESSVFWWFKENIEVHFGEQNVTPEKDEKQAA